MRGTAEGRAARLLTAAEEPGRVAFDAENQIPGAPAPPPIGQCANPTITGVFNLNNAPPPPPGSRLGDPVAPGPGQTNGTPTANGNTGPSRRSVNTLPTATTVPNGLGGTTDGSVANPGELVSASGPVSLPGKQDPLPLGLYVLAGALVLLIVFAPPTVAVAMRSRERNRGSAYSG